MNDCIKLYHGKEKLKNKLKAIDNFYFTCDTRTSNQTKSYITFTAHYVDVEWKLHKKIINFRHFLPPCTGYAMASMVIEFMMDWEVEDKFFPLTLDNATANEYGDYFS